MHMTLVVHIVVHPHTHTRSHVHPYKGLYRHTYSGQAHFSPVGCSYAHQPSRNNSAENPWRNYDKWHLIMREVEKKTVNKVTHSQWKPNKRKHNCFWLLFFFFFFAMWSAHFNFEHKHTPTYLHNWQVQWYNMATGIKLSVSHNC